MRRQASGNPPPVDLDQGPDAPRPDTEGCRDTVHPVARANAVEGDPVETELRSPVVQETNGRVTKRDSAPRHLAQRLDAPVRGSDTVVAENMFGCPMAPERIDRRAKQQGPGQEANEQLLLAALAAQDRQSAAERALGDQTALLARVAHELRNPLTPIRTAASLIDRAAAQDLPRLREVIERQVDHVSRMVGDLLDLSRAQAGKLRLQRSVLDVCGVLAEVLEASQPAMEARRQRLLIDIPVQPLLVNGDRVRLAQILSNLLDNASKYTPAEGVVTVAAHVAGTDVVISVSDTGIGIRAETIASVFQPFVQDFRATSFNGAGLGIGLTVVRELVEAHGGKVQAFSAGEGHGSQFVLTLPRHAGVEGPDEAVAQR